MQHRVPKYIAGWGKSYALLSSEPGVDTAVIFVHGFGGKPTSTWLDFQSLADEYSTEYPWWATNDMYFFAYDSIKTGIRRNAELLAGFTENVLQGKWLEMGPQQQTKYSSLIFVGHSEGKGRGPAVGS